MRNSPVRHDLIHLKLAEIRESVTLVRDHLPGNADEFIRLGLVKDGMYKQLEYAIENVFDICAILNTDLRLGIPSDDSSLIDHLVRKGILDEQIREKLSGMKGFRNILVHRYGRIDDTLAYSLLTERIDDFEEFSGVIVAFLKKNAGSG